MSSPQHPYRPGRQPGPVHGGGSTSRKVTVAIVAVLGAVVLVLALGVGAYAVLGNLGDGDRISPAASADRDETQPPASHTSRPTPTSDPAVGKGVEFTEGVLEKLNDGDAAGAKRLLCPDSESQANVDEIARGTARLQIDRDEVGDTGDYVGIDLKGTLDGRPISEGWIAGFLEDDGWCVHTIFAIP